jgi:hypothetical protein
MTIDVTRHQHAAPSDEQRAAIAQVKAAFPYRIAYGALNPLTGEFIASAVPTLRIPNKLSREGWQVWTT